MAAGGITPTTHDKWRPTVWAKDTLDYFTKELVVADTIESYDEDVAEYGQKIEIPLFSPSGAARTLTPGTDITFDTNTEGSIVLNVDKWKYKAHQIFNMTKVQSKYNIRSKYTKDAAYTLKDGVEIDVIAWINAAITANEVSGNNAFVIPANFGGTAVGLTDAKIRRARVLLDKQNVPSTNRYLVVNPDGLGDIFGEDRYASKDFAEGPNGSIVNAGNKPVRLYGFELRVSNNIPVGQSLAYHEEVAAKAIQQDIKVTGDDNVRSGAWEQRSDIIYGGTALRQTAGIRILDNHS